MITLLEILCSPFILILLLVTLVIVSLPFIITGALMYAGAMFIFTLYKDFERDRHEK